MVLRLLPPTCSHSGWAACCQLVTESAGAQGWGGVEAGSQEVKPWWLQACLHRPVGGRSGHAPAESVPQGPLGCGARSRAGWQRPGFRSRLYPELCGPTKVMRAPWASVPH